MLCKTMAWSSRYIESQEFTRRIKSSKVCTYIDYEKYYIKKGKDSALIAKVGYQTNNYVSFCQYY